MHSVYINDLRFSLNTQSRLLIFFRAFIRVFTRDHYFFILRVSRSSHYTRTTIILRYCSEKRGFIIACGSIVYLERVAIRPNSIAKLNASLRYYVRIYIYSAAKQAATCSLVRLSVGPFAASPFFRGRTPEPWWQNICRSTRENKYKIKSSKPNYSSKNIIIHDVLS